MTDSCRITAWVNWWAQSCVTNDTRLITIGIGISTIGTFQKDAIDIHIICSPGDRVPTGFSYGDRATAKGKSTRIAALFNFLEVQITATHGGTAHGISRN